MSVRLEKRSESKKLVFRVSKRDLEMLEEFFESVTCLGA